MILYERYENNLHAVATDLADRGFSSGLHPVLGDVTDQARVEAVLAEHRPEIVFHAAAHKHVPLMEHSPCEAVKNNVRGTRLLAEAAERAGVDRFMFISTDKAVNPTSVMGVTKRVAGLIVQTRAPGSATFFSAVRFGNVLASNGSVIPRFTSQIANGGPVTVTHPEMRRFFMLIPEAVQLVLHAAAKAEAGDTAGREALRRAEGRRRGDRPVRREGDPAGLAETSARSSLAGGAGGSPGAAGPGRRSRRRPRPALGYRAGVPKGVEGREAD